VVIARAIAIGESQPSAFECPRNEEFSCDRFGRSRHRVTLWKDFIWAKSRRRRRSCRAAVKEPPCARHHPQRPSVPHPTPCDHPPTRTAGHLLLHHPPAFPLTRTRVQRRAMQWRRPCAWCRAAPEGDLLGGGGDCRAPCHPAAASVLDVVLQSKTSVGTTCQLQRGWNGRSVPLCALEGAADPSRLPWMGMDRSTSLRAIVSSDRNIVESPLLSRRRYASMPVSNVMFDGGGCTIRWRIVDGRRCPQILDDRRETGAQIPQG